MRGPLAQDTDPRQTLFENIFECSPDAIVVTDGNGRITNVNSQVERVFGYTQEELLGFPVEILMPERFRAAHPTHRRSYSDHPSIRPMGTGLELYGRRKDGREFPIDIMLSPVETPGGPIFLSVVRDISEKKRIEEKVRQSEAQLQELIDAIPQQVFVFDADWSPLFANRRELEYTGLTLQESQSKDAVSRIFHPEDFKSLEVMRERMRSKGAPFEMEARIRGKDGQYRWFLVRDNPLRDEQGRVLRWYGTRTDIEDRKQVEEAAHRMEKELRDVIETIPVMVFTALPDGSNAFANRRLREYTGFSAEIKAGSGWQCAVHPEDVERHLDKWRVSVATGEPLEDETRFRRSDGEYRWFLIRAVPLRDEHGNILKWYGKLTDIEDRKRAEEAWSKAQADLARVTRVMTMGELAASIAHEVNQPIAGVVMNASSCLRWLAADPPNLEEARESARRMIRDGERAGNVITRIRALATKTDTAKERLDMNEIVRAVVVLARDELYRNRVTLRTEFAEDLLSVLGDRVELQQLVLNLVMNAIESMREVGDGPRELVIRTQNDEGGQVRVTVRDSGIGLDPGSMEQMFETFYTTKVGGMGMGLSICRSIIQSHEGRLWAVANDGPGATFQFTVPKFC